MVFTNYVRNDFISSPLGLSESKDHEVLTLPFNKEMYLYVMLIFHLTRGLVFLIHSDMTIKIIIMYLLYYIFVYVDLTTYNNILQLKNTINAG